MTPYRKAALCGFSPFLEQAEKISGRSSVWRQCSIGLLPAPAESGARLCKMNGKNRGASKKRRPLARFFKK